MQSVDRKSRLSVVGPIISAPGDPSPYYDGVAPSPDVVEMKNTGCTSKARVVIGAGACEC